MLTIWRSTHRAPSLLDAMNRIADDVALHAEGAWSHHGLRPPADVLETDAAFEVVLDMPGLDPKAIQIQVEEQVLQVQAERRQRAEDREAITHRSERPAGTWARTFALPATVDGTRVEARYDAGVLTVTLPKREESKPRTVQVKVG